MKKGIEKPVRKRIRHGIRGVKLVVGYVAGVVLARTLVKKAVLDASTSKFLAIGVIAPVVTGSELIRGAGLGISHQAVADLADEYVVNKI